MEKIGAFAGVSGRTVEKIADVVRAAEAEPETRRDPATNLATYKADLDGAERR